MEDRGIFSTPKRQKRGGSDVTPAVGDRVDFRSTLRHRVDDDDGDQAPRIADGKNIEGSSTVVISVVENRARETCICKIDTSTMSVLQIFLLSDNHSYNETIGTIQELEPDEILLHDAAQAKVLTAKIQKECRDDARVLFISRQYFDQDRGAELLKKVLAGEVDADLVAKYTVLSGAYCLLRYLENCNGIAFGAHSVRVAYGSLLSNKMVIDRRTAINLELISNARSGSQIESLFGVIDHTKTVVGARLLRSSILRPTTDIVTINTRLDFVQQLLSNNRAFREIVACLGRFPDLDKTLTGLSNVPRNVTQKNTRVGIDTLIYLKQALQVAPDVAAVLMSMQQQQQQQSDQSQVDAVHPLLGTLTQNLSNAGLQRILRSIMDIMTESTAYSKSAHEMRNQECFALKSGIHGLLDVARKTFLQAVEDLYRLADKYSLEHSTPVKLAFSSSRGYYLSLSNSLDPLPAEFTQAVLNKRSISCSTEEFTSISTRAAEAIAQALSLTHELIQNLLAEIRVDIDALFALTDSVALLDMLTSFADLVALSPHTFVRPRLEEDGPMVIKAGRHPVISTLRVHMLASSFVANDVFISPLENVHIMTGPNGSGKTVYIKQIALISIMAQIGCFVPAQHATIPIRNRILSRLATSDDMEHNMSTFFTEMKEISYLLDNVTDRSLVIIDELGRGTSTIDGLSLAFSIAEKLIGSKAITLFVTHYPQITNLAQLYPTVKNCHMTTSIGAVANASLPAATTSAAADAGAATAAIRFLHRVSSGACDLKSGYGLLMAEHCGFPVALLDDARKMRRTVQQKFPILVGSEQADRDKEYHEQRQQEQAGLHAVNQLLQHLQLLKNSTLNDQEMCHYLQSMRGRLSPQIERRVLEMLQESSRDNETSGTET